MNVDNEIARLKHLRAWAERERASAASDPQLAAETERTIELAERAFRKKIMDAEGRLQNKTLKE